MKAIRQSIFGLVVQLRQGRGVLHRRQRHCCPPPLSREEELALMRRMDGGDATARATLIERNLRLVVYIARQFENTGISIEDLISIGTIGLIKAVNSFDPDKNIKLATYASRCIENEILMVLRKTSRLKLEVSFDEPLNTDWDGNELLLSDILGTEADLVSRDLDAAVEKQMLAHGHPRAQSAGAPHRRPALRPRRRKGAHAEGSRRHDGHLPELHIPPGKDASSASSARKWPRWPEPSMQNARMHSAFGRFSLQLLANPGVGQEEQGDGSRADVRAGHGLVHLDHDLLRRMVGAQALGQRFGLRKTVAVSDADGLVLGMHHQPVVQRTQLGDGALAAAGLGEAYDLALRIALEQRLDLKHACPPARRCWTARPPMRR